MTSVGVMLPVRIETRFDSGGPQGSARLRVIVIPAEVWSGRHDPRVGDDEYALLRVAAESCDGELLGEAGAAAFERLAGQVGAARAAWLATTLLNTDAGWRLREPELRRTSADPAAPRTIRGLPPRVELWATLADSRDVLFATMRPKPELAVEPGGPGQVTFWPRWGKLKRAGLSATVNLAEVDPAGPIDPATISVLTAVGIGDTDPADLLADHQRSGAATLMPPGSATNTTREAPYRRPDPDAWRRSAGTASSAAQQLSAAVGATVSLPGADDGHRENQSLLMSALWPALWGHAVQDLARWPAGQDAGRIRSGLWWAQYVFPEGPYPSLCVGDQPYGVLPATDLGALPGELTGGPGLWAAIGGDAHLPDAARRGEQGVGTVVDASTDEVLRVLAHTPVSTHYSYRWSVPAAHLPGPLRDAHMEGLRRVLDRIGVPAEELAAPQIALGASARVDVPLVGGDEEAEADPPGWLYRMLDDLEVALADGFLDEADLGELHGRDPKSPGSRHRVWLLRMLTLCRHHAPEAGAGNFDGVLETLQSYEAVPSLLVRLAVQSLRVAHAWPPDDGAAAEVYRAALEGVRGLALRPMAPTADLERTLRATLDCATHRLDALPVAAALAQMQAMDPAPRVLGLYGWVDSPLRGEPGFSKDRAVLAPSPAQAKAAAILKDRFAVHCDSGQAPADAWDLGLDSAAVRRAVELLEAVAEGAHPGEALGRRVEACFPRYADVLMLRGGDPAAGGGGYPADDDAPLRRTCDGLEALHDWGADRPGFTARTGLDPAAIPASEASELDALAAAAGVVADLHLLEAVHDTVQGGSAVVAQALDSLAGLGEVPELRSVRTPVPGTPLTTRVMLSLPRAHEPGADADRAVLADPATAVLLDGLGDAADPVGFGWQRGAATVTLADLGLQPGDLAAVDDAALLAAVAESAPLPQPPGANPESAMPPGVVAVRKVVTVLARCTPPAGAALAAANDAALRVRFERLHAAAAALQQDLAAAAAAASDDPALRRRALRWGLTGGLGAAADTLAAGLARCPAVADVLDPDPKRRADPGDALRRLAAVGRSDHAAVVVPVLVVPDPAPQPEGAPGADEWHSLFARVRPALAQFREVLRDRITDTRADGWAPGWTGRAVPGSADIPGAARELAVFYALDGSDPGADVLGVLDQWLETLPGRWAPDGSVNGAVSATAAFGFNTPGARAQQAVILAVPPSPDAELDIEQLRRILAQTRLLVRARAVRGRDLGRLGALLPSAYLPADARRGIVLDDSVWQPPTDIPGLHVRLEQSAPEGDVDAALQARTADPLWMMTRQWELGEHQGENATSPVWVRARVKTTPLSAPEDRPFADLAAVPGSAALEAAGADWPAAGDGADPFDPSGFVHATALRGGGAEFATQRHAGGNSDWWSVDAVGRFRAVGPARTMAGLPGRMRYPGAPAPGWCTLEEPGDSVMGHLPDTAHVGSLFFLDVLAGHSTDWYLMPLPAPPGRVLSLGRVTVVDAFGDPWELPPDHWGPAQRWSAFRTTGLGPADLLLWPVDPPPLAGPLLERVVLGVDEDANLLWAVEDVVAGGLPLPDAADPAGEARAAGNAEPQVRYEPLGDAPPRWHPYPAADDAEPRRYRQGRLATSRSPGTTGLPAASSRILPTDVVHEIDPAAVPARGLVVERRWVLARAADGSPVVWQQRTRGVPVAPPALRLPFDVVTPAG